jgi:hypothetical protein
MRKLAITLAAAGAALGLSAPASAQFYPQPAYGYGYAQPAYGYGYAPRAYGYGYAQPAYGHNSGAVVQYLDMRIASIRSQIRGLQARGLIRHTRARTLDRQALNLQRSIRASAWNGIGFNERRTLELRVARLEQQVRYAAVRNRYAPRYAGYRW